MRRAASHKETVSALVSFRVKIFQKSSDFLLVIPVSSVNLMNVTD